MNAQKNLRNLETPDSRAISGMDCFSHAPQNYELMEGGKRMYDARRRNPGNTELREAYNSEGGKVLLFVQDLNPLSCDPFAALP
jgi:hypothetical protein